jgi:DNA-binding Lrp family transcriptional regulator
MEAYILINVKTGAERPIYETLKKVKGIVEVNELYGEWDLIAKVSVQTVEDLDVIITEKIRSLPDIRNTTTMIVAQYKH